MYKDACDRPQALHHPHLPVCCLHMNDTYARTHTHALTHVLTHMHTHTCLYAHTDLCKPPSHWHPTDTMLKGNVTFVELPLPGSAPQVRAFESTCVRACEYVCACVRACVCVWVSFAPGYQPIPSGVCMFWAIVPGIFPLCQDSYFGYARVCVI